MAAGETEPKNQALAATLRVKHMLVSYLLNNASFVATSHTVFCHTCKRHDMSLHCARSGHQIALQGVQLFLQLTVGLPRWIKTQTRLAVLLSRSFAIGRGHPSSTQVRGSHLGRRPHGIQGVTVAIRPNTLHHRTPGVIFAIMACYHQHGT